MNPIQQTTDAADEDGTAAPSPAPPREPFSPRPDKNFFYPEPTRAQRLKLLHHLAPYGELLIVTGDPGSGKSTLLEQFVDKSHPGWRLCVLTAEAGWGPTDFLDALIVGFAIHAKMPEGERAKLELITHHCISLKRSGLVAVIVVDDAEYLDHGALTVLQDLLQALDEHEKPLRVILFAAPRLREAVSTHAAGLQERITHTFNLPPFSEKETGHYLRHRLKVAGLGGSDPFTDSVVKMIHRTSQGLPAKVNELARVVMANNAGGDGGGRSASYRPRERNWNLVPVGVAAVVLAGLALYFIKNPAAPPRPAGGPPSHAAASGATTVPLVLPPAGAQADAAAPMPLDEPAPAPPAPPPPAAEFPASAEAPAPPSAPVVQPGPAPSAVPPPAPEAAPVPPLAAAAPPPAVMPPPAPAAAKESHKPAPAKPAPAHHAVAPAHHAAAHSAPAPAAGAPRDAAWLLARPAGHYTLQLVATKQGERIPALIAKTGLDPRSFAHFQILSHGAVWHVLTYGDYADHAAAAAKAAALPAGLRRYQPWARAVGDLQAAVKQYQDLHP